MNTIDDFERGLVNRGFAVGPNGASYRLGADWNDRNEPGSRYHISVRRVSEDGELDNVVGFDGQPFQSIDHARRWAIADARCAGPCHTELSKRAVIA